MIINHIIGTICILLSFGGFFLVGFSAGFNSAVDFLKETNENDKHDSN
jgi:hypothetical protein